MQQLTWMYKWPNPFRRVRVLSECVINCRVCVTHCRSSRTPPLWGPSIHWGSSPEGWNAGNAFSLGETACSVQQPLNSHSRQTSAGQKWTKKVVMAVRGKKKPHVNDPGSTEKQNDLISNVNSNIFAREQKSLFLAEYLKYKQNKNLNPWIAQTITKCWQGEPKGKSSSYPWTYYLM